MTQDANLVRQAALRACITAFLTDRLQAKLDGVPEDDQKRQDLIAQFQPDTWLEDAARRVGQIQGVTHALKPTHPDAKGTNVFVSPLSLEALPVIGSHCLDDAFAMDVVGNAAALDVYKFLRLVHEGKTLLDLALANDQDLKSALSENSEQAEAWMQAFASLVQPRGRPSSHAFAKQVYWRIADNPHDDNGYHLLAPLFATSLAHKVYQIVQNDRFGDAAKVARQAKREKTYSPTPVHEYPDLAIQKLGGTKPQNISQLNSERRGENLLFASLPPNWQATDVKPLLRVDSLFRVFGRRPRVRRQVQVLRDFLVSDPPANQHTRQRVDTLIATLIDELLQFAAELRTLPAGWTKENDCLLPPAEKHWLDPDDTAADGTVSQRFDSATKEEHVARSFANWLNGRLKDPLPMGDQEFSEWRHRLIDELKADTREARA